ncbi:MAG: ferritin-like domain-containing protein, partial [Actinomycetota bacterium]|nr:ferritin-like domain-containing protein [Actinomycetota bacterium]
NIVPTDENGLAFSRTAAHVLNIAYLSPEKVHSGGFFPDGVNGTINTSGG